MRLIVGLGNPGIRYAGTRHNIGFEVVDRFARRHGARLRRRWCRSLVADLRIRGEEFLLAKPQTFMNLSGEAVRELLLRTKAAAADILVVCDDINLPLGRIRLRPSGSAGGHHGLESIIACIRSQDFPRLRVGVGEGNNRQDVRDHVLGRFHPSERKLAEDVIETAADCLDCALQEGLHAAMNRFNGLILE
ncbi:MAG: peptidyl-tRNA hydrolase [Armatimonadota bacterium]|nr:MAG: peptidyl-tRNA hydrolase [Armatimonadota bacterium]